MKQTSTSEKNNNEIYVTISTNKHPKEYLVKTCLKIKYDSDKIVITPGYSKSYSKNMFCHSICPEKIKCKKKTWDNTCFRNKDSEVDSSHAVQPHITRHNKFFHITAYKEGTRVEKTHPLASYCEYDRTPLSHLSDYEVISCFRISSYSIFNDLLKDYLKKNKKRINLLACTNTSYNCYVFVNPISNTQLYNDLGKFSYDYNIFKSDKYELVIATKKVNIIDFNKLTNFTSMYIKCHGNNGVGNFKPDIFI